MKPINDLRCLPKRLEDRAEAALPPPQPFNLLDGRTKPSSWQRSAKRKFHSSACDPLPQARKQESMLRTSRSIRPQRPLACVRKSMSDPLQVFGDANGSENQHSGLSGTTHSDLKDGLHKCLLVQHGTTEMEKLSKEKRYSQRPGLKDSTNLDPKAALKQNSLQICSEVLALKEALRAEKEAHRCLQAELDEERNAASSAANEAMAMISRLQEEKAGVLMESRQFKRMAEERELHNQEAIALLKEMLFNKEEEAMALENELYTCRQMFLAIEAGEPAENYGLKFLEFGSYHGRPMESELESAYSEEGFKRWTSTLCDPRQYSLYTNDPSKKPFQEQPINSEFYGRRYGRCFKDLASDNVRSNLENYFIQAEESLDGAQNYSDVDIKRDLSTLMCNKSILEFDRSADMLKGSEGSQAACQGKSKLSNTGIQSASQEGMYPPYLAEEVAEPVLHFTDEQTRSLWERVMKLEHRLENFGADEQGFEFDLQENVTPALQTPGFTGFPSTNQQVQMCPMDVTAMHGELCSEEANTNGGEYAERPTKLQCRGGTLGFETSSRQTVASVVNSACDRVQVSVEMSGKGCSKLVDKESHEMPEDIVEGVLDIYEVGHRSNEGSDYDGSLSSGDNSIKYQFNVHENSDLPLELTAPDLETMDVNSHSSMYSPPKALDVQNTASSSLSEMEKQDLNMRLQVLESEKQAMHEAILSLQRENKELKLLHDIASELKSGKQLQNLKRNVQSVEQPSKRAKSEHPSFTSFLKGFLSYLPNGSNAVNAQERSSGVLVRDQGCSSTQTDHVGLSHLLSNSPHLKSDTLIQRGLKVKVPAGV